MQTLIDAATYLTTPIGTLRLRADEEGLTEVSHVRQHATEAMLPDQSDHPVLSQAARELSEYFQGRRKTFSTPLSLHGSEFQAAVWEALKTIPYGETRSYEAIALQVGSPKAVRAVGAANGRNPLSVFIPCHRVIGKNGRLTGYAGGLQAKQWLLEHERHQAALMR